MVGRLLSGGQSLTGFIFVNRPGGPGSWARLPAQAQGVTGGGEKGLFLLRGGGHLESLLSFFFFSP